MRTLHGEELRMSSMIVVDGDDECLVAAAYDWTDVIGDWQIGTKLDAQIATAERWFNYDLVNDEYAILLAVTRRY